MDYRSGTMYYPAGESKLGESGELAKLSKVSFCATQAMLSLFLAW